MQHIQGPTDISLSSGLIVILSSKATSSIHLTPWIFHWSSSLMQVSCICGTLTDE